jgi:chromate transport protein ChrA
MNFKGTATLQGTLGVAVSVLLFVAPQLLLAFLAPFAMNSAFSETLVRLIGLFLGAFCVSLLATRSATEFSVQRNTLLTHMVTDLFAFVVILVLTGTGKFLSPGGYVLAIFLLANAMGYLPCYRQLSKPSKPSKPR